MSEAQGDHVQPPCVYFSTVLQRIPFVTFAQEHHAACGNERAACTAPGHWKTLLPRHDLQFAAAVVLVLVVVLLQTNSLKWVGVWVECAPR